VGHKGQIGRAPDGSISENKSEKRKEEIGGLVETHGPKSKVGCRKFLLNFLKALWVQNSKFQNIFELGKTKINLYKVFEDFSNFKLSKS
jgi:hypothetical protein